MEGLKSEVTRRIQEADQEANQRIGLSRVNAFTATEGHYRRDCPERKKSQDNNKGHGELDVAQDGYESAEVLWNS